MVYIVMVFMGFKRHFHAHLKWLNTAGQSSLLSALGLL